MFSEIRSFEILVEKGKEPKSFMKLEDLCRKCLNYQKNFRFSQLFNLFLK